MINIDSYKQLIIEEHELFYSLELIDNKGKTKITKFFKKEEDVNKMLDLLKLYLKLYKVNGVNRFVPTHKLVNDINLLPEVILSNDKRKINLKTKVEFFKIFSKMVLDNYAMNKEKLLEDNEIEELRLDASSDSCKFSRVGNIVNLTLESDANKNIRVYERQFIMNLLEHRCAGEKIIVEETQETNTIKRWYIASCGDFRMIFPKEYTYSTIIGTIREYNKKIDETRKRR